MMEEKVPIMKDAILIKGNKSGLTIIINDEYDFEAVKNALYDKLNSSRKFFGQAKVTLTFEGKNLSNIEQNDLIDVIQSASDLEIICIIDAHDEDIHEKIMESKSQKNELPTEETYDEKLDKHENIPIDLPDNAAIFHKGTLRSGQELVVDSSIIILGNVHYGAKVAAKGNVIVIGKLNGYVHAGMEGNSNAFIVALNMNPTQLRIAHAIGRSSDKKNKKINSLPQIAILEDDQIIIENINRNIYEGLNIFNY